MRHLLYGDAIFDEANNKMFHWRLESIKWISFLATGIVRETKKKTKKNKKQKTKKKQQQQLGMEYLQRRSWFSKLLKDFWKNLAIFSV